METHSFDKEEQEILTIEEEYSDYEEDLANTVNELYRAPLFDGRASLTARMSLPAKRFDVWVEVSAVCGNGTLVSAFGSKDHFFLGFVEGRTILHWNAGSGLFELRSGKVKVDGKTKISAKRYKKDAMLRSGTTVVRGTSRGRMTSLDVDPFIYVGLPPENVTRLTGFTIAQGFIGCIHRLRVSGHDVIPPSNRLSISSHGLKSCTPHNLARLVCP